MGPRSQAKGCLPLKAVVWTTFQRRPPPLDTPSTDTLHKQAATVVLCEVTPLTLPVTQAADTDSRHATNGEIEARGG